MLAPTRFTFAFRVSFRSAVAGQPRRLSVRESKPNQSCRTRLTEPVLPNPSYRTRLTEPVLPNQVHDAFQAVGLGEQVHQVHLLGTITVGEESH